MIVSLFFIVLFSSPIWCLLPNQKPKLNAPDATLNVIKVSNVKDLAKQLWNLKSNTAIVIEKGTYNLAQATPFPNG